jgi:hypothetical protein
MGVVKGIGHTEWPKQGSYLHKRTEVLFKYVGPTMMGTVVRDDAEAPHKTIIRLDDGRYVMATECQYSPLLEPTP